MKYVGFKIQEDQLEKLKEIAKKEQRVLSNMIRKIISEYIDYKAVSDIIREPRYRKINRK